MWQSPQLSKIQRAFGKLGQVASSQAVGALIQDTRGTSGGQDGLVVGAAIKIEVRWLQ